MNMIGYNFRLGEIECAIGIEQLKKLKRFVSRKQEIADQLTKGLTELPNLTTPFVPKDQTHVYYDYPLVYNQGTSDISRERIYNALVAEGVPGLAQNYQNIHLLPIYQKKIAYGIKGFPWTIANRDIVYQKGICPNAEKLNDKTFLGIAMCMYDFNDKDVNLIIAAFQKVWDNLDLLQ